MRAAVPAYLGNDFSQAAPGHRFGLYYAGWNDDFTATKDKKTDAVRNVCTLPDHSQKLLAALLARQSAQAQANADSVLALPCLATSPFATGLGNEHPLENGFSFLTPYGLSYLQGSGVKGVIRRAAEELESGEWGDAQGWTKEAIRALFGPGEEDFERDRDTPAQQGALRFWDVLPKPAKNSLAVEIMTPHLGKYYQGEATPNTSLTPNPIPFLAVPAGSGFTFHIECLPSRIADAEICKQWKSLVEAAFTHAAEWLGFGAKTAVGYGRMALDAKVLDALREQQQIATKEATRAAMTPNQQRIEDFTSFCMGRAAQLMGNKENSNAAIHNKARELAKAALEGADWTAGEKQSVANAIEEWLPNLVKLDIKDERKKLKIAALNLKGNGT